MLKITREDITVRRNIYRQPLWEAAKEAGFETGENRGKIETDADFLPRFEQILDGKESLDHFVNSLSPEELVYLCVGNAGEEDATFVTYGSGNAATDAVIPMAPGTCDTTTDTGKEQGNPKHAYVRRRKRPSPFEPV